MCGRTYDWHNLLLNLLRERHDLHKYCEVYLTPVSNYYILKGLLATYGGQYHSDTNGLLGARHVGGIGGFQMRVYGERLFRDVLAGVVVVRVRARSRKLVPRDRWRIS